MNRSQSKFHNTAVKMNDALLRLLERKDFKDISIIELCEEAGVNRSTFYAHYDNIYDLLKETHRKLIKSFFEHFPNPLSGDQMNKMEPEELIFITPQYLVPYLEFVKNNKRIFKTYQTSNAFDLGETDRLLIENVFVPVYARNGVTDKLIVTYMSKFFVSGVTAITMEWVNRDCIDDLSLICEIICICVRPTMKFSDKKV